tara:strand:+ start:1751 stop:2518 length:768 start_codon:yes stop_codon:yes gene_type:complete
MALPDLKELRDQVAKQKVGSIEEMDLSGGTGEFTEEKVQFTDIAPKGDPFTYRLYEDGTIEITGDSRPGGKLKGRKIAPGTKTHTEMMKVLKVEMKESPEPFKERSQVPHDEREITKDIALQESQITGDDEAALRDDERAAADFASADESNALAGIASDTLLARDEERSEVDLLASERRAVARAAMDQSREGRMEGHRIGLDDARARARDERDARMGAHQEGIDAAYVRQQLVDAKTEDEVAAILETAGAAGSGS